MKFLHHIPFLGNLAPRKRVLLGLRLMAFMVFTILNLVLLVGSVKNCLNIYIHKLQFSHLNVARGLYNALADNVNSERNSDDPYGPGFTTSEIQILVDYTSGEFDDSPQFLVSAIWNYCYGTYDSPDFDDFSDNFHNFLEYNDPGAEYQSPTVLSCSSPLQYYFNYRALLGQIGFTIILEYAYDGDYSSNAEYSALMQSVHRSMKILPNILIFAGVAQVFILLISVILYHILLNNNQNRNNLAILLQHINAALSSAIFVAVTVAVINLTIISFNLKSHVSDELGDFGISLHLGRVFFTTLWVLFATSFVNFCLWGGVAWCTVPDVELDHEEKFYRTNHRKSLQTLSALTGGWIEFPQSAGNTPATKYDEELKKNVTFMTRTNTGMSSAFYGPSTTTRSSSKKYLISPFTKGSFQTNNTTGSGNLGNIDTAYYSNYQSQSNDGGQSEESYQNPFMPTGHDSNGLKVFKSNSDLVSMVSENDTYANNIDYNQILESTNGMSYSGFGLRKNGTIKNNLTQGSNDASDIEQQFFTVQQYGYSESPK
ncbi:Ecm7 protein [Saccharomycopsis crataegensis]|uniref:Ecm7 protein n=1 Tax=Saccharomycopsis crataegensis TaxID=43959 RepID=A0AAV5QKI1_9ASCO|nr:Ecm7 protein [Saccharomycopsis crataegensis]